MIKFSLLICTRNRAEAFRKSLEFLSPVEIGRLNGELVLVDSASTDMTWAIMNTFAEKSSNQCSIRLLRLRHKGLGLARNVGTTHCAGQIIILGDDDCYFPRDHFAKVIDYFEAKDGLAFIAGRILQYDTRDAPVSLALRKEPEHFAPKSFVRFGLVQGANLSLQKNAVMSVGNFDKHLGAGTPFPSEDTDLVNRLTLNGFSGAYEPNLYVFHDHKRQLGPEVDTMRRSHDFARGGFFMKMYLSGHIHFLRFHYRHLKRYRKHRPDWLFVFLREVIGGVNYFFYFLRVRLRFLCHRHPVAEMREYLK